MITPGLRFTGRAPHLSMMFMITEADADAIRAAFFEEGELSAAIELRRRFPGITDNAQARTCARTGVVQLRVTPKTRNPFTTKALSIFGVIGA